MYISKHGLYTLSFMLYLDILPYDILMFTFFYPYIIKMPAPVVQMCIFKIRLYEIKEKVIVKKKA